MDFIRRLINALENAGCTQITPAEWVRYHCENSSGFNWLLIDQSKLVFTIWDSKIEKSYLIKNFVWVNENLPYKVFSWFSKNQLYMEYLIKKEDIITIYENKDRFPGFGLNGRAIDSDRADIQALNYAKENQRNPQKTINVVRRMPRTHSGHMKYNIEQWVPFCDLCGFVPDTRIPVIIEEFDWAAIKLHSAGRKLARMLVSRKRREKSGLCTYEDIWRLGLYFHYQPLDIEEGLRYVNDQKRLSEANIETEWPDQWVARSKTTREEKQSALKKRYNRGVKIPELLDGLSLEDCKRITIDELKLIKEVSDRTYRNCPASFICAGKLVAKFMGKKSATILPHFDYQYQREAISSILYVSDIKEWVEREYNGINYISIEYIIEHWECEYSRMTVHEIMDLINEKDPRNEFDRVCKKYGENKPEHYQLIDTPIKNDNEIVGFNGFSQENVSLGYDTHCCQHRNGVGETAMAYGMYYPKADFLVCHRGNKIIFQSEVWEDFKGQLILDNIESANGRGFDKIENSLRVWVEAQTAWDNIILGKGYSDYIPEAAPEAPIPQQPCCEYVSHPYTDTRAGCVYLKKGGKTTF